MERLLFGTAGTPVSSRARDSVSGIKRVRELGLDCMEIEFVRGVRMGVDQAQVVNATANKLNVALSIHAPYYINLNSPLEKKLRASMDRIIQSARIGLICGAESIAFHAAYYQKDEPKIVYSRVKKSLKEMRSQLDNEGVDVILRPETTGKPTQFGSLEELLNLSNELDGVLPCIDFSHLHARTGRNNSKEEFSDILAAIEDAVGKEALDNMHIHVSGIEYTSKGEKKHLNLKESDMRYLELVKAWKEFDIKGLVISESPNLEVDAMLMRDAYGEILINE
jgi:deoxyribonuclease-4